MKLSNKKKIIIYYFVLTSFAKNKNKMYNLYFVVCCQFMTIFPVAHRTIKKQIIFQKTFNRLLLINWIDVNQLDEFNGVRYRLAHVSAKIFIVNYLKLNKNTFLLVLLGFNIFRNKKFSSFWLLVIGILEWRK